MYETNEEIPSLDELRKKEREKLEESLEKKAKDLLLKAIDFYNENYPNTEHKNIWNLAKVKLKIGNKSLNEELEKLTEKELQSIYDIFQYFHEERQMKKVEDHNLRARIIKKVRNLLPGGSILEKLYELYKQRNKINKEIKKLEDILTKEREKFLKRLNNKKEEVSHQSTCKICGKICKSEAGLTSHMRVHL